MYENRYGYRLNSEPLTSHTRRRYRLVAPTPMNQTQYQFDPQLWIVHYSRSEPHFQVPVGRLPVAPQTQAMIQQRRVLQQHGQLLRKEFMLYDRSHWPTLNLPGSTQMAQYNPPMPGYIGAMANRNQQPAYLQPQQVAAGYHGMGPSPAKRPRHGNVPFRPVSSTSVAAAVLAQDPALDDEDESGRDLMDYLTPREISTMRYKQHHEWMEEVYASPYAVSQILPVDLGLGLKGELESLTDGFFDAPMDSTSARKAYERISSAKAETFTTRARQRIAEINADMEKMKRTHEKRMAKLRSGGIIKEAENDLRKLATPSEINSTHSQANQSIPDLALPGNEAASRRHQQDGITEIVGNVEAALGRRIEVIESFKCVQKGGLEEKGPSTSGLPPGIAIGEDNMAGLHADDMPSFEDYDSMVDIPPDVIEQPADDEQTDTAHVAEGTSLVHPDNQGDVGDWVMVDEPNTAPEEAPTASNDFDALTTPPNDDGGAGDVQQSVLPDFGNGQTDLGEGFEGAELDQSIDFDNLDTAGEELAGYEASNDPLPDRHDDHAGFTMDSAFGDAVFNTSGAEGSGSGEVDNI
jgi:hypothetical protein